MSSGGADGDAAPLETAVLSDGSHELFVVGTFDDGSTSDTRVTFATTNGLQGLVVSTSPHRLESTPLDGSTLSGDVYITYAPGSRRVDLVLFYIDDEARAGEPSRAENYAPFDLAGVPAGNYNAAQPLETGLLGAGPHTVTAESYVDGVAEIATASFEVVP